MSDHRPAMFDPAAVPGAVGRFLALTSWEVEQEASRQARRNSTGTTWLSLSKLMQRNGYRIVAELGVPAALSWGVHLGVISARAAGDQIRASL